MGPSPSSRGPLREEIDRLTGERLIPLLLIMFAFWIVCAVEWTQKVAGAAPDPRFWTMLSLVVTAYGGLQVFRLRPKLVSHGPRGEHQLVQILSQIRSRGFLAFHSVPSLNFNIDHVVIGPSGIYTIKAKVRSGSGTIAHANENELLIGGRITDGRALRQARELASALNFQLKEHLPADYPVKPLLVFPGDWQVDRHAEDFGIAVLSANELEDYFLRQQPELTGKQITDICAQLERGADS